MKAGTSWQTRGKEVSMEPRRGTYPRPSPTFLLSRRPHAAALSSLSTARITILRHLRSGHCSVRTPLHGAATGPSALRVLHSVSIPTPRPKNVGLPHLKETDRSRASKLIDDFHKKIFGMSNMDRSLIIDMPREKYVERCKQRAFDYLDQGDQQSPLSSVP